MKACENCVHSRPVRPYKTRLERWERDKRPMAPKGFLGGLRWAWNPSKYKDQHPYDNGDNFINTMSENWDKNELNRRKNMLVCTFNPEHIEVNRNHYCGRFQVKLAVHINESFHEKG